MKIAICGITGLIGSAATRFFRESGCEVIGIGRDDLAKGVTRVREIITGADVIVNLAGSTILKRWTTKGKKEIYNSRVVTTRQLVEAVNGMKHPPRIFISASAVGIYDDENFHDEFSSNFSVGFLGEVCREWEAEVSKINPPVRICIFRLGVVLTMTGGALKKMVIPFKICAGGKFGSGKQYFPFIHLNDVVQAFKWVINSPSANGIYNLTAPRLITNKEFTALLSTALHRPALLTVPLFALRLILGEASVILSSGQRVNPARLTSEGFIFEFPTLEQVLKHEFPNKY